MSASGNRPAAELPGLWLLDCSFSWKLLGSEASLPAWSPRGREGFEREAHPSSLFRREDTAPRKGSRLPEVPQPLQTSACRLSRHQDEGVRQRHVCEGQCSPTSAGSDVHSLSTKTVETRWSESHSASRASSGPASTGHMHKACFLKHLLPCCTRVNLFFFFLAN